MHPLGVLSRFMRKTYTDKLYIAHEHFLDFDKFGIQNPLTQRNNLVAYIGRLNEGKGILNFLVAIGALSDYLEHIKLRYSKGTALRGVQG